MATLARASGLSVFCLIASFWAGSGQSQSVDYDLLDMENDSIALFYNAYPVLEKAEKSANLKYYVVETCGVRKSGDCEMFEFSCSADNPGRYNLLFWALHSGHFTLSRSIMSGYELPHVIYFDRLVERHRNNLANPPATDPRRSEAIVNFYFKKAERLPEKGDDAYILQWDTQTKTDAQQLGEMLSSGETLLAPYPVRLRRLVYNKLHPRDDTDKSDIAKDFVVNCHELWGQQR